MRKDNHARETKIQRILRLSWTDEVFLTNENFIDAEKITAIGDDQIIVTSSTPLTYPLTLPRVRG